MPTRLMAQQLAANPNNMNGQVYDIQSRAREVARNDDSGSGGEHPERKLELACLYMVRILTGIIAEGRSRKRLPKSTSDGSIALRRPEIPISSTSNTTETRSSLTSRRQSVRDPKVPLGSHPVEASPSKMYVVDAIGHDP